MMSFRCARSRRRRGLSAIAALTAALVPELSNAQALVGPVGGGCFRAISDQGRIYVAVTGCTSGSSGLLHAQHVRQNYFRLIRGNACLESADGVVSITPCERAHLWIFRGSMGSDVIRIVDSNRRCLTRRQGGALYVDDCAQSADSQRWSYGNR